MESGIMKSWRRGVMESWSLGLLGHRDGYLGEHFSFSSLIYEVVHLIMIFVLTACGPIPDT